MTLETMTEERPVQLGPESEETAHGFMDMMEAVEEGIRDGAHEAQDAVSEGIETTGRAVRGAARGTADALSWVLDVPGHVSRHPWLLVGAAVLVGFLILRRRRRE
jgi:hypothetical protein